jgi:hypothetical protein
MTFDELQVGDRFMFSAFRKGVLRKVGPEHYVNDADPEGEPWPSDSDAPFIRLGDGGRVEPIPSTGQ